MKKMRILDMWWYRENWNLSVYLIWYSVKRCCKSVYVIVYYWKYALRWKYVYLTVFWPRVLWVQLVCHRTVSLLWSLVFWITEVRIDIWLLSNLSSLSDIHPKWVVCAESCRGQNPCQFWLSSVSDLVRVP